MTLFAYMRSAYIYPALVLALMSFAQILYSLFHPLPLDCSITGLIVALNNLGSSSIKALFVPLRTAAGPPSFAAYVAEFRVAETTRPLISKNFNHCYIVS